MIVINTIKVYLCPITSIRILTNNLFDTIFFQTKNKSKREVCPYTP